MSHHSAQHGFLDLAYHCHLAARRRECSGCRWLARQRGGHRGRVGVGGGGGGGVGIGGRRVGVGGGRGRGRRGGVGGGVESLGGDRDKGWYHR